MKLMSKHECWDDSGYCSVSSSCLLLSAWEKLTKSHQVSLSHSRHLVLSLSEVSPLHDVWFRAAELCPTRSNWYISYIEVSRNRQESYRFHISLYFWSGTVEFVDRFCLQSLFFSYHAWCSAVTDKRKINDFCTCKTIFSLIKSFGQQ
jgi:hypothetical protein